MNSHEVTFQGTVETVHDLEDDSGEKEEGTVAVAVEMCTQSARVDGAISSHTNISTQYTNSPIRSYLSSPSASNKQIKKMDCKFCFVNLPPSCLIDHLKEETNKKCKFLYLKINRVSSLQSLVAKIFSCEMCYEQKRINFQRHLEKKQQCLKKFQMKFGLKDVKDIDEKVKAVKRKTFPSRSSDVVKSKYEAFRDSKTLFNSLNDYRDNVALANFKLCIQCRANYRDFGAKEVLKDDELFDRFNLSSDENKLLRRFETFFICNSCLKDEESSEDEEETNSSLDFFTENEDIIFFPPRDVSEDSGQPVHEKNVKLWFPNTFGGVEQLGTRTLKKIKKKSLRNLYKTQAIETSTISDLYKLESEKYKKVREAAFFSGIINDQTKTVNNLKILSSCDKISSSKDWFKREASRMKERQEQFGYIHAFLKIDLEMNSLDVVATSLIQGDIPVTMEKKGLSNGEMEINYKVHVDHKSDINCSSDCKIKLDIQDFINETGFHIEDSSNANAFTSTYVSSCHQKLVSFARNIIQAPASGLFSHDYQLHLSFDKDGKGSILGCFWPLALDGINDNIAEHCGDIVDEEALLKFVDQNISCTADERLLRTRLGLSEEEARQLSELVLAKQVHDECEKVQSCKICSFLPMPSMETLMRRKCCEGNYEASNELINMVKKHLTCLSMEEKKGIKTWTFLEDLWKRVGGQAKLDDEVLTFSIANGGIEMKFETDGLLCKYLGKYNDSIQTAVYHYALSCCGDFSADLIVMQRIWIIDCHILPFNPLHLKSNKTTSILKIVNNTNLFNANFLPKIEVQHLGEKMDQLLPLSHRLMSLAEAIAISDPQIKMVQTSSEEQFVNTKEGREALLRKVTDKEEEIYHAVGSQDMFKLVIDPISRHFNRNITSDRLLLSETLAWYDYAGEEKSRELTETYKNSDIPLSDQPSICSRANLPEYILCRNGDVLCKRKKRKVIIVPTTKTGREVMYAKSLLFLPIRSELELKGTGCEDLYKEVNREEQALQVEINERKMFPKRIMKMTRVDQLDDLLDALDALGETSDDGDIDEES